MAARDDDSLCAILFACNSSMTTTRRGLVSHADLKHYLKHQSWSAGLTKRSDFEWKSLFAMHDVDGDGYIDSTEFRELYFHDIRQLIDDRQAAEIMAQRSRATPTTENAPPRREFDSGCHAMFLACDKLSHSRPGLLSRHYLKRYLKEQKLALSLIEFWDFAWKSHFALYDADGDGFLILEEDEFAEFYVIELKPGLVTPTPSPTAECSRQARGAGGRHSPRHRPRPARCWAGRR